MSEFSKRIKRAKEEGNTLFYNTSGSKTAYQLGIKHISSAEFLGFADTLPNGDLRVKKAFILVDFESLNVIQIKKGSTIIPVRLENA